MAFHTVLARVSFGNEKTTAQHTDLDISVSVEILDQALKKADETLGTASKACLDRCTMHSSP